MFTRKKQKLCRKHLYMIRRDVQNRKNKNEATFKGAMQRYFINLTVTSPIKRIIIGSKHFLIFLTARTKMSGIYIKIIMKELILYVINQ